MRLSERRRGLSKSAARRFYFLFPMADADSIDRLLLSSSDQPPLNYSDVLAKLDRLERTLGSLQHNVDDFYFVSLTAVTFGKTKFSFRSAEKSKKFENCKSHAVRIRFYGGGIGEDEKHDQHPPQEHRRRL